MHDKGAGKLATEGDAGSHPCQHKDGGREKPNHSRNLALLHPKKVDRFAFGTRALSENAALRKLEANFPGAIGEKNR